MSPKHLKSLATVLWILAVLSMLPLLNYARMAFLCDSFSVKGHSMDPTLLQGRKVWVNKLLMGARIYKSFDFDTDTLDCFRLPGLRKLETGDIAVFNYPRGWTDSCMGFNINYVYAKRCVAIPGDSISIKDSRYRNSRAPDTGIPKENELRLRNTPDSLLLEAGVFQAGHFAAKQTEWTIKDFGPLLVPYSGLRLLMDDKTLPIYKDVIEFETGRTAAIWDGMEYEFAQDYYFFAGDNVIDSKDSRYIGFVPLSFVIGIVNNVLAK